MIYSVCNEPSSQPVPTSGDRVHKTCRHMMTWVLGTAPVGLGWGPSFLPKKTFDRASTLTPRRQKMTLSCLILRTTWLFLGSTCKSHKATFHISTYGNQTWTFSILFFFFENHTHSNRGRHVERHAQNIPISKNFLINLKYYHVGDHKTNQCVIILTYTSHKLAIFILGEPQPINVFCQIVWEFLFYSWTFHQALLKY